MKLNEEKHRQGREIIEMERTEGKNARVIVEIAKAVGRVEVLPGFKLFTGSFFKVGQTISFDVIHSIKVYEKVTAPFVFALPGATGELKILTCDSEENAVNMINLAFATMKEAGFSDDWPLSIPDIRISQEITEG